MKESIACKDMDLCEGSKDEEFAGSEEFEMLLADESILAADAVEGVSLEVVEEDDGVVENVLVDDVVMNSSPGEDVTERENSDLLAVGLPLLGRGKNRLTLIAETRGDPSLATCRALADSLEWDYGWEEGVLVHSQSDDFLGVVHWIVLLKVQRSQILSLALDRCGHLGYRKEIKLLKRRFAWPNMAKDVKLYCQSCPSCQIANKAGHRRVPMVERPTISEPFQSMAIDIVGPSPKANGGVRYLLTSVCMATRWPDMVALKSCTACAVAEGLVEIFSWTGLPSSLLSDQGPQFTGSLMENLSVCLE